VPLWIAVSLVAYGSYEENEKGWFIFPVRAKAIYLISGSRLGGQTKLGDSSYA